MQVLNEEIVVFNDYNNIMIDLETMGQGPGCRILSLGAVAFDPFRGFVGPSFYVVFNRENQQSFGFKDDPKTVKWWESQNGDAKIVIGEAEKDGKPTPIAFAMFEGWLSQFSLGKLKLWSNGADFDLAILQYQYSKLEREIPWNYWNNRCYRTFMKEVGLAVMNHSDLPDRLDTHHNALADAKHQAYCLNMVYQKFIKLLEPQNG